MEPIYPEPEFFFPGTFEVEPPYREGNPENLHQAGLDGIDPAYDANHSALTGVIGFDPMDLMAPSLDTREDIEHELPQWGPPFVKFVDGRLTQIEKRVIDELEKWKFQTRTDTFNVGLQTSSAGAIDDIVTQNAKLYTCNPGFSFALHRLVLIVPPIVGSFSQPYPGIGTSFEASGSTAAAPVAGTQIATLNVVNGGLYNITVEAWQSGTPDANLENAVLNVGGSNVGGSIPTTNVPNSVTFNNVTVSANPIRLNVGSTNGGAGAVYNGNIVATLVGTTGFYEIRVNNEAIDGGPMQLPLVRSWGTRDAPHIRDGEILSLFMASGPLNARITAKGQGSLDRTIEG